MRFSRLISFFALLLLVCMIDPPAHAKPENWKLNGWDKTDFETTSISYDEIIHGGPPKDGIPSIDEPNFIPASQIEDLGEKEPVVTVKIGDEAKAYPLRILIWHEIVNDTVGGQPVTVTYCPLCNSAMVFDRTIEGRILDFGTTGLLRNSDLVMYDRQTQSWWQQFTGEAIVGSMTGTKLQTIPVRLESFERFIAEHPDGPVLIPNNPRLRRYGMNPYWSYDSRTQPERHFFRGEVPDYIEPMARVVALKEGEEPRAVAMALVREKGSVKVGDITVSWIEGQSSALDTNVIAQGREVGNIIAQRETEMGLTDVVYDVTFAFVFHAFHPEQRIQTE